MAVPLDLNLIRVFVAIYEARSVSVAGERLHVTQPTVSYGLSKLRALLQDQLFIRSREGMQPTLHADRVYLEFVAAIRRIDQTIDQSRAFEPASSSRRFVVAMSDIGEMIFLPPILDRLQRHAPDIEIEVVQPSLEDLRRKLTTGEVVAAVGNFPLLAGLTKAVTLFNEHYVCLLSGNHSRIAGSLTIDSFRSARHVHVASTATGHDLIERALQKLGIERHIVLSISHFAILSHVIAMSDLLAMVPSRVGVLFEQYDAVRSLPLPFDLPAFQVQMHWHENDEANMANKWFRQVIRESLSQPQ